MRSLFTERDMFQVVPVHKDDYELLGLYGVKHCFQKIFVPFLPNEFEEFEKRHTDLMSWLSQN